MPTRRQILVSLSVVMATWIVPAVPAWADMPMIYAARGAAIGGYDPVAYFNSGAPVPGKVEYAVKWKGAMWRFANAANREQFESNPRAFAPQFGGYCAYAVSRGHIASTEPEAWRIEAGKLYLIHNLDVHAMWSRDVAGNIAMANANWPSVLSK